MITLFCGYIPKSDKYGFMPYHTSLNLLYILIIVLPNIKLIRMSITYKSYHHFYVFP